MDGIYMWFRCGLPASMTAYVEANKNRMPAGLVRVIENLSAKYEIPPDGDMDAPELQDMVLL